MERRCPFRHTGSLRTYLPESVGCPHNTVTLRRQTRRVDLFAIYPVCPWRKTTVKPEISSLSSIRGGTCDSLTRILGTHDNFVWSLSQPLMQKDRVGKTHFSIKRQVQVPDITCVLEALSALGGHVITGVTSSKRPGRKNAVSIDSGALVAASTITFVAPASSGTPPSPPLTPIASRLGGDGAPSATLALSASTSSPAGVPNRRAPPPSRTTRVPNPSALQRARSSMQTNSCDARRDLPLRVVSIGIIARRDETLLSQEEPRFAKA